MDKVEEMWAALAAYQPHADAAGHGPSWERMCKEKTADAAAAAADDADAADAAAAAAADAAAAAANAADKKWAQKAIERITRVLVKPAPLPVQPTPVQEPVHQWRQKHSPYWYDGYPDNYDGGGPYETRVLYTTPPAAQPAAPLTADQCRAAFDAWYSSPQDAPEEPERIYELTDESMSEMTKECIWLGWQAAHGITKGGAA